MRKMLIQKRIKIDIQEMTENSFIFKIICGIISANVIFLNQPQKSLHWATFSKNVFCLLHASKLPEM